MEMPIQQSLIAMEIAGMAVDSERLEQLAARMDDQMRRLEAQMYKTNGRRFNVASSAEVAKVLGMRGKNGKVSTAKAVLQKLTADPMSGWIMQWRKLSAALQKTLRPLQQTVYRERVHANSWCLTQTGRISMHEPNVQNVAKDFVVTIGWLGGCTTTWRNNRLHLPSQPQNPPNSRSHAAAASAVRRSASSCPPTSASWSCASSATSPPIRRCCA